MKKVYLFLVALLVFTTGSVNAQSPGCANIIAPPDFTLPCTTPCTTLTAVPFHVGNTSTYTVSSIPHAPVISYSAAGGTAVSAGTDDVYSPLITLPFPFCFYGNTYTTCKVGSNGNIQFGAAGGGFCPWSFTANCPNAALPVNSIFGVYHDIDPSICGNIRWHLVGTAPCRMLVVNFNTICHFSCTTIKSTHQIVLYETTNVIEVYVSQKPICAGWNGGRAIIGIQNSTGAVGLAAPGRNSTPTWTPAAGGEGWRFTPNGAPIYTVSWYQGATLLATGTNSVTVCPTATTTYTASITYTRCDGLIINDSDPITITMASLPPPTVTPTAETCAGYNNGSVVIDNAAGPGPFTVSITGPTTGTTTEPNTAAGTANFSSLPDGTYTYTVTSAAGCTYTGTFTIAAGPPCCSVTATGVNPLCNGGTGTATANPVGLPTYSYSWSTTPIQTTQTATGLAAGTYTVTMTDASGCVATNTVTITQPTAITASTTSVNPLCNGGATGSITVTASGGTGALQYSLNGGAFQTSPSFTGLTAGSYTIVVKDANGCTQTLTVTLTNPPLLTIALGGTTPATCGASNGTINVVGAGGTGTLSYDLNPGPVNTTGSFTALAAGTYTVIVTDANGCTATLTPITVGSSPGPTASIISQTNLSCFGGANGSVLIGATGGTAPIQYQIDLAGPTPPTPFQLSNSFSGLTAGTYTVNIQDANGCTGTTTFTITAPPQLTYTTTFTNATCNGVCNGTITVTAAGGTPAYEYSSNNGLSFSTTNPMTGLCAGTTFVVVRDANGCLANSTVVITQPAAMTATYTPTNPICPDICNGQVVVNTVTGGTGPYQYSANGGANQPSNTLTGLCDGANTITVTDANGCPLTATQTLVDPPHFTITVLDTNESHCGFNDGGFEIVASGGFAPYTYNNITSGITQATGLFGSLVAGGYDVEVTDNNGCVEQIFVGVNDVEMDGILDGLTNATCFGSCDGTVQTHAINGAAPIQYELDLSGAFMLSGDFTGLCAGSHIVTITDNGFCVFTIPFDITEPDEVTFSTTVGNIACSGGATGTITFTGVAGGSGVGYQYSIDGGGSYQASPTFTGLAAGTYTLSVMDNNGCLGSGTAIVDEADPITFTTNITDLTCFGNNSGFLQIVATGGTGALTYSITGGAPFGPGFTFVSLAANTYNIVVQDAAGCQVTGTATINQPTPLVAGYTLAPTLCNGSCDGSITVNASGGTAPYEYSDDNGTTYQVSNILSGECAGTYQVIVRDDNDCIIGSSQTITQPTAVTFATTVGNATCGNNNGTIDFTGTTGGTPTYQFSTDNGTTFSASPNFTGLAPGSYNLIVEDFNGCQFPGTATVLDEASPVITAAFITDVTCNAACDGSLNSTATGGTGALTFDIGGTGQATGNFASLCAGTYTLTVSDGNGCTDTQGFTVAEPTPLTLTTAGTNLLCFNDNTGQINLTAGGGTTPYMYSYDGGATFTTLSSQTNLSANTYNIILQDANNCQVTGVVTLTEPTALAITSQPQTNASCFGVCDGTATLNITGGTVAGLYNYNWAGGVAGPTQNNATGLCAGSYAVTVTDDNGCTINANFNITEPPQVIISGFSATDALCNGSCDGTISIVATGVTGYSIDGGTTFVPTSNFTSVCPGTYSLVVEDAAGCTATASVTVNEPSPVIQDPIADITICYGGFGTLNANATGGTPPYTYTWDTGDISQFYSITSTTPVTFTCTVTDLNGCVSNPQSANVSILPVFVPTVSGNDTICPGQAATFTASGVDGVPGYDYLWLNAAGDTLGTGSPFTYTPSSPETITLIASDQCPTIDTINVDVVYHTLPTPTFVVVPANGCSPLNSTFVNTTPSAMTSGGTCTWDFGDGNTSTGCVTVSNTYILPGCYDVTLTTTSADGCVGDSTFNDVVCVYPDPIVDFTYTPANPTILSPDVQFTNLTINGNTYSWHFGDPSTDADSSNAVNPSYNYNNVEAGEYMVCLSAVSPEGCIGDTCKPVTIYDELLIYVPNAFTPDGDGTNDIFLPIVKGIAEEEYELMIFDRWGEMIYYGTNKAFGWDGTHKNKQSKEDVYVWKIKAKSALNGDKKEYIGHVSLLR